MLPLWAAVPVGLLLFEVVAVLEAALRVASSLLPEPAAAAKAATCLSLTNMQLLATT
jgi:hypothetical protein